MFDTDVFDSRVMIETEGEMAICRPPRIHSNEHLGHAAGKSLARSSVADEEGQFVIMRPETENWRSGFTGCSVAP